MVPVLTRGILSLEALQAEAALRRAGFEAAARAVFDDRLRNRLHEVCSSIPGDSWRDGGAFFTTQSLSLNERSVVAIPPGASLVFGLVIGGGSGGGGGRGAASGARSGGGGGAASASTRFWLPRAMLPDRLYARLGLGGAGGAGAVASNGGNGTAGAVTQITTRGAGGAVVAASSGVTGNAGGGGNTGSGGGAPGGAHAAWALANAPLANSCGFTISVAGPAGGTGGLYTGAAGTDVQWGSTSGIFLSGGAGGGGIGSSDVGWPGGAQLGAGPFPGLAGGAADGGHGPKGISWRSPLLLACGGPGGGSNAGTAGNGGDGGYGCGGGGGGGGVTSGAGGRGGDGIAILVWA